MPSNVNVVLQKFGRQRLLDVQTYMKRHGQKLRVDEKRHIDEVAFIKSIEALDYRAELKGNQINDLDDIAVRMEEDLGITRHPIPNPGSKDKEPVIVDNEAAD